MGKKWKQYQTFFSWAPKSLQMVIAAIKLKRRLFLGRKAKTNLDSILKSRDITTNKGPHNQCYGFSSIHVWMWKLDHKEGWALKNGCLWTVVLEKILESLLDSKEIELVNPKGNQPWIFIGRTDAEAPIFRAPDVKNQLIGKDPDSGKDWGQEEKGTTEDEMLGWPVGDGQGGLACCDPWGHKELDTTEQLNWTEVITYHSSAENPPGSFYRT